MDISDFHSEILSPQTRHDAKHKVRISQFACVRCGEPMMQVEWNRTTNMLSCQNKHCIKHCQPQGYVNVIDGKFIADKSA